MKWTVQRYVLREVVQTWLAVTGVLVAILVSNQLSRVLGQAADNQYGYGPVFRSQSLDNAITRQLSLNGGHLTRAGLVTAMESAATVDLTGAAVLPELLATVNRASQPPAVRAMKLVMQPHAVAVELHPRRYATPSRWQVLARCMSERARCWPKS